MVCAMPRERYPQLVRHIRSEENAPARRAGPVIRLALPLALERSAVTGGRDSSLSAIHVANGTKSLTACLSCFRVGQAGKRLATCGGLPAVRKRAVQRRFATGAQDRILPTRNPTGIRSVCSFN